MKEWMNVLTCPLYSSCCICCQRLSLETCCLAWRALFTRSLRTVTNAERVSASRFFSACFRAFLSLTAVSLFNAAKVRKGLKKQKKAKKSLKKLKRHDTKAGKVFIFSLCITCRSLLLSSFWSYWYLEHEQSQGSGVRFPGPDQGFVA